MSAYADLVRDRRACRRCAPELVNPGDPTHAELDGDEVGPWTRWLGARPARLAVVGQDWGTVMFYRLHGGLDPAGNRTNERLARFLGEIGCPVPAPGGTDQHSAVFLTNAILCLKEAATMSAPTRARWFANCSYFLRRTLDITQAPTVVCLGVQAYRAVAGAYGVPAHRFAEAVEGSLPLPLRPGVAAYAVFHPAARPVNRTLDEQVRDWARLGQALGTTTR